jgi:hypothetical protein
MGYKIQPFVCDKGTEEEPEYIQKSRPMAITPPLQVGNYAHNLSVDVYKVYQTIRSKSRLIWVIPYPHYPICRKRKQAEENE